MSDFKLDRNTCTPQTMQESANHKRFYAQKTWQERLSITAFLNSVAFKFDVNNPPRMNRSHFSAKSFKSNG